MLAFDRSPAELPYFLAKEVHQAAVDRMRAAIAKATLEEIVQYYDLRALKSGSEEEFLGKIEKVLKLFRDIHVEATTKKEKQKEIEENMEDETPKSKLSLHRLPRENLLQVLRLMTTKSLCRLRQTSKTMDAIVEKLRFLLSRPKIDSPWVLRYYREDSDETLRFYIYNLNNYKSEVEERELGRLDCRLHWKVFNDKTGKKIEDPIKQLSAVPIGWIDVEDPEEYETFDDEDYEDFANLRLNVIWLTTNCSFTLEMLSVVKYQRLFDHRGFPDIGKWNLKNLKTCRELTWTSDYYCKLRAEQCLPLLGQLEALSVDFNVEHHDDDPKHWFTFLQKILMTVTESKTKPMLKTIRLTRPYAHEMHLPLEPTHLYGFKSSEDDGTESLELLFFEHYSRATLFEAVWSYFCPFRPLDNVFENFMNASTDSEALEYLREVTSPFVEFNSSQMKPIPKKFEFL